MAKSGTTVGAGLAPALLHLTQIVFVGIPDNLLAVSYAVRAGASPAPTVGVDFLVSPQTHASGAHKRDSYPNQPSF